MPTDRDREMAREVLCRSCASIDEAIRAAELFAQARAEGAREERRAIKARLTALYNDDEAMVERAGLALVALHTWIEAREEAT